MAQQPLLSTKRQKINAKKQKQKEKEKNAPPGPFLHYLSPQKMIESRKPTEFLVEKAWWPYWDEDVSRYRVRVKYASKRRYHEEPFENVCRMDKGFHEWVISECKRDPERYGDLLFEMESWKIPFDAVCGCFPPRTFPLFANESCSPHAPFPFSQVRVALPLCTLEFFASLQPPARTFPLFAVRHARASKKLTGRRSRRRSKDY